MLYCDICFETPVFLLNCNHSYCEKCNKKSKDLCLICNEKKQLINLNNSPDDYIVYENLENRLGLINTSRDNDRIYYDSREIRQNEDNRLNRINRTNPLNLIFDTPNTLLFEDLPALINTQGVNNLFFPVTYPINTVDLIYIPINRR